MKTLGPEISLAQRPASYVDSPSPIFGNPAAACEAVASVRKTGPHKEGQGGKTLKTREQQKARTKARVRERYASNPVYRERRITTIKRYQERQRLLNADVFRKHETEQARDGHRHHRERSQQRFGREKYKKNEDAKEKRRARYARQKGDPEFKRKHATRQRKYRREKMINSNPTRQAAERAKRRAAYVTLKDDPEFKRKHAVRQKRYRMRNMGSRRSKRQAPKRARAYLKAEKNDQHEDTIDFAATRTDFDSTHKDKTMSERQQKRGHGQQEPKEGAPKSNGRSPKNEQEQPKDKQEQLSVLQQWRKQQQQVWLNREQT